MGTGQVELMTMTQVCTFVRPKSLGRSQSFKDHHLRKTPTDIADIVESLSKITFTVKEEDEEEKEEQEEYKAKCDCCGLLEECTPGYVARMRATFFGKLVCGLCAEAVKEERMRMGPETSMEEALYAHMKICFKFNFTRQGPAADLAQAMRQVLRRDIELGAHAKPKGQMWQRAGLSRSETFSNRGGRQSIP